jgi:REP element-mobilizing transposase RayT
MSIRNVVKTNTPDGYFHIHVRGLNGQHIFLDEADYQFFYWLFEGYLSKDDSVEVLAYCLIPSYFHLLLHETSKDSMLILIHSVMAKYSRYFNQKYRRNGSLFESDYKIIQTLDGKDLLNISRDIHLSSNDWIDYPNSSLRAYFYDDAPRWLNKTHIAKIYGSAVKYLEFLEDYQDVSHEIVA